MAAKSRGLLIVFEGLDKAGKSTQCKTLVENLQQSGRQARMVRFPNRSTPIGSMIGAYLTGQSTHEDHVIHLLFSANRWEAAAGIDVVVDRYYYSGCVYSAAKQNPTLDLAWARHPEQGLPRPDICIFLDISPQIAAERGDFGSERYEQKEMQARVRSLFQHMRNSRDGDDFVVVDGGREILEVQTDISRAVQQAIDTVTEKNLPLRHVEP